METGTKKTLELTEEERTTLKEALEKYLSELRLVIADTKRHTEPLHKEKDILMGIAERL